MFIKNYIISFLFFSFLFLVSANTLQALCHKSCHSERNCKSLLFFIKNQNKCSKCLISKTQCAEYFCQAYPMFCKGKLPISNLSLNTMNPETDMCFLPIIPTQNFRAFEKNASSITLHNLNNVDIRFFSETKGQNPEIAHERNLGALLNLASSYLCVKFSQNREKSPQALRSHTASWVSKRYNVNLKTLNFFQLHMITDSLRVKILTHFKIPFIAKSFLHEGHKYTHHISAIGCASEQW